MFTANVTNTVTAPVPTGSVQFLVDGGNIFIKSQQSGQINGAFTLSVVN